MSHFVQGQFCGFGSLKQVWGNLWGCLVWGGVIFWSCVACTSPSGDTVLPFSSSSCQDIITALEERLRPLVQAELSVLVDVLHWPELLFLEGSEAHQRCESGGFLSK